jgi:hypothetical protein
MQELTQKPTSPTSVPKYLALRARPVEYFLYIYKKEKKEKPARLEK